MKLSLKNISALELPPGSKDAVFWDDDIAGFGIRIRKGGSRTWIYRYRRGSKQRSMRLGSAKSVPLTVARENASKLEAEVRLGGSPPPLFSTDTNYPDRNTITVDSGEATSNRLRST